MNNTLPIVQRIKEIERNLKTSRKMLNRANDMIDIYYRTGIDDVFVEGVQEKVAVSTNLPAIYTELSALISDLLNEITNDIKDYEVTKNP